MAPRLNPGATRLPRATPERFPSTYQTPLERHAVAAFVDRIRDELRVADVGADATLTHETGPLAAIISRFRLIHIPPRTCATSLGGQICCVRPPGVDRLSIIRNSRPRNAFRSRGLAGLCAPLHQPCAPK